MSVFAHPTLGDLDVNFRVLIGIDLLETRATISRMVLLTAAEDGARKVPNEAVRLALASLAPPEHIGEIMDMEKTAMKEELVEKLMYFLQSPLKKLCVDVAERLVGP